MKCEIIPAQELAPSRLLAWDKLLAQAPVHGNPNLSPWFTTAVAAHRPTMVGMLSECDRLLAVLPFHREADGVCEALALGVSDYHGPLVHPECRFDYLDFLRRLEIGEFRFDHLLADFRIKQLAGPWHPTHLINLAKGETAYRWELRDRGSGIWQEMQSQIRRLQRVAGPVTFIPSLGCPEALDILIGWKRSQFQKTQAFDDFGMPWNAPFLHELLQVRERSCCGLLSGLFVGGHPIALHMGSLSPQVLQTCYTAYDPAYADYSPGSLLLFFQVRHCLREGISILDLGKGDEPYKRRWANDRLWVAEGSLLP